MDPTKFLAPGILDEHDDGEQDDILNDILKTEGDIIRDLVINRQHKD